MAKTTLSKEHVNQLEQALSRRRSNHEQPVRDAVALESALGVFELVVLPKIRRDDTNGSLIIWEADYSQRNKDVANMLEKLIKSSGLASATVKLSHDAGVSPITVTLDANQ